MGVAQANAATGADTSIEYTIYVYPHGKGGKWERKDTTADMHLALKKAEELTSSREFQKVEVKKKFFDKKNGRQVDMTLKTFSSAKKKTIGPVTITIFAVFCGLAAFGITVLLV